MSFLIREVVERSSDAGRPPVPPVRSNPTGFPTVQHRSKSEFSKARSQRAEVRASKAPVVSNWEVVPSTNSEDDMSQSHERLVAAMSPTRREKEVQDVEEQLGPGIKELMLKVRAARERRQAAEGTSSSSVADIGDTVVSAVNLGHGRQRSDASNPSDDDARPKSALRGVRQLERPASTPPSARKLRFAEPGPADVHVYESAPSSPRRVLGLLPPAGGDSHSSDDASTIVKLPFSRFQAKSTTAADNTQTVKGETPAEQGTPDDIRLRYFPSAKSDNLSLEWMRAAPSPNTAATSPASGASEPEMRYDLSGHPISHSRSETLPTHLGLHHHADPSQRAGYTLSDLLHLSRSTVASQRSTMLTVLSRILLQKENLDEDVMKQVIAVGVDAFGSRGNLNVCTAGIEVIWAGLVKGRILTEAILMDEESICNAWINTIVSTLPLDFILPSIAEQLQERILPSTSQRRLLQILIVLASTSPENAKQLVDTPSLIDTLFRVFLPIVISEDRELKAVQEAIFLLNCLARASREIALELRPVTDSLLRFIIVDLDSSTTKEDMELHAAQTLMLFASLARYGLHAHIATTAHELFRNLSTHVVKHIASQSTSSQLARSWIFLLECWIVCATDPHKTTPPHEILWTQVEGWGWGETLLDILVSVSGDESGVWDAACNAVASWLEGAAVNSPAHGLEQRTLAIEKLGAGRSGEVSSDQEALLSSASELMLCSRIRLYLALSIGEESANTNLIPPISQETIEEVVSTLLSRSSSLLSRAESQLCLHSLKWSKRMASYDRTTWLLKAFDVLLRLPTGEEDTAKWIFDQLPTVLSDELYPGIRAEKSMQVVLPFLTASLRAPVPQSAPSHPSSEFLRLVTTLRNPPSGGCVPRQWTTWPINHLLRSGTSPVFQALPPEWDASETEVVQASLWLTLAMQRVLPEDRRLKRAEVVFECMKVFMLEHGQTNESADAEVFRDGVVERLMPELLTPFKLSSSSSSGEVEKEISLEDVSKSFLSDGTPFFQFYSDFLGLYDSISFSHPLFGSLLLPPLSSLYASDYRELLFGDYAHLVHTIKTSMNDVLAGNVRDFLYPVHTNGKILASFLRVLSGGKLEGFVYFIVLHHLACNIWPDLRLGTGIPDDQAGLRLLEAIARKCPANCVGDVLRYGQRKDGEGTLLLPSECSMRAEEGSGLSEERKGWVLRNVDGREGDGVLKRLAEEM